MSRIGSPRRRSKMAITQPELRLARDGGTPARTGPERPMFPGGMEVGDEELQALERVIRSKNLFRYYGVGDGPQEVDAFERELAEHMGVEDRKSTRLNSSHLVISYAVFCLKKNTIATH